MDKTIENFQCGEKSTEGSVETLLREHDASKQTISELFKFTETESEQIIVKIRQQVNFGFDAVVPEFCAFIYLCTIIQEIFLSVIRNHLKQQNLMSHV